MSQGVAQSPGNCNCDSSCSARFHATGCGKPLRSKIIQLWDHEGGTLLASGTTDGSGNVTLFWSGSSGTYWVIPASGRWKGANVAITCGSTSPYNVVFLVAAGYICSTCDEPLKNVLHVTNSVWGSTTITYNPLTLRWEGVYRGVTAGGCECWTATLDIPVVWGGSLEVVETWYVCNLGLGPVWCPWIPACGGPPPGAQLDRTVLVIDDGCPPAFFWIGTYTSIGCLFPFASDAQFIGPHVTAVTTITE